MAETIKQCEITSYWHREIEPVEGSPFRGGNVNKPPGFILEKALASGTLLAALLRRADGVLITIPARSWRRDHHEPMAFFGEEQELDPPTTPFGYAALGRDIPAVADAHGNLTDWGTPVIAEFDLAVWFNEAPLPIEPAERPADWVITSKAPPRDAIEKELRAFLTGYAFGIIDRGDKPATRDDHRRIAAQQYHATNDQADKIFHSLPARLKNRNPNGAKITPK